MERNIKNPRSMHYELPTTNMPQDVKREYEKMALSCAFPSAWQNGLFHFCFGLFLIFAGAGGSFSALFGTQSIDAINIFSIVVGVIFGAIIAYAAGRYIQINILVLRDACFYSNEKSPFSMKYIFLILVVFLSGIYSVTMKTDVGYACALACVYTIVGLFAYAKSDRLGTFVLAILVFVFPEMFLQSGGFLDAKLPLVFALITLIDGLLFLVCGINLFGRLSQGYRDESPEQKIKNYLLSDDEKQNFKAALYGCMRMSPKLTLDLLKLTQAQNLAVRYVAQVALSNIWGPSLSRIIPKQYEIKMPPKDTPLYQEVYESRKQRREEQYKKTLEGWENHLRLVEKTVSEKMIEDKKAFEYLLKLALGEVIYEPAMITSIELLGSIRTKEAYSILMTLLLAEKRKIFKAAISGFYGADSSMVLYLEKFFVNKRAWVRRRAISATRAMLDYLDETDTEDFELAMALLKPDLEGLLNSEDTSTFAAAISLLPRKNELDIQTLEIYCENARPIIKIEAMRALLDTNLRRARNYIFSSLSSSSMPVRYASVRLLGILGKREETDDVAERLQIAAQKETSLLVLNAISEELTKMFPMESQAWQSSSGGSVF